MRINQDDIPEFILCAAVWVDTGKEEYPAKFSRNHPRTGLVFSGWRHGDCIGLAQAYGQKLSKEERERIGEEELAGRNQGFLTSRGRFVGREEARKIAEARGQIVRGREAGEILFSENLY